MEKLGLHNYKKSKILNISHKDLDGVGCSIVLGNVFSKENINYMYSTYSDIENILNRTLKIQNKYDYIILTDITPNDEKILDKFNSIIVLDHHDSALKHHNPVKNRAVISGECATKLTKKYCDEVFGKKIDLSYLNDLVEIINDYDMWIREKPMSWELNELFFLYWDRKFRKRFFDGNLELTEYEKQFIKERKSHFNKLYDELKVFELDHSNGYYFEGYEMINDLCHTVLNETGCDIVFCRNTKTKSVSVRTADNDVHIGKILDELNVGGGHNNAGGINSIYDLMELKQTIDIVDSRFNEKMGINNYALYKK